MMRTISISLFITAVIFSASCSSKTSTCHPDGCEASAGTGAGASGEVKLRDNWRMIASNQVSDFGEIISSVGYNASGWYAATVPSTVQGTLADNGVFGDVFYGAAFDSIPGSDASEYWYRTEFASSSAAHARLILKGISYEADVWLNGTQIAWKADCNTPFIPHEYLVTDAIRIGTNALAIKVSGTDGDYPVAWNDWNRYKPVCGIIRDVIYRTLSGDVEIRDPYVVTTGLPMPDPASADVSVRVYLDNCSYDGVSGVLKGEISKEGRAPISFQQTINLPGCQKKWVTQSVTVPDPQLWWPYQLGTPDLYQLKVWFEIGGLESDSKTIQFGIRQFREYHTSQGWWGLKINDNAMLVRGAGYSPEIFLRSPASRSEAEMRYFKNSGLNVLRFEGYTTIDELYDICDREGIVIMNGENCIWESHSGDELMDDAMRSMIRWQMREYRHHPSFGIWNSGSDTEPSPTRLSGYEAVLSDYSFRTDNAYAKNVSEFGAASPWDGIKMMGPYNYENPYYFWEGNGYDGGGAWGFCAEAGPGAVFPEYESLVKFIPPASLWPIDSVWESHAFTYKGDTDYPLFLTQTGIDNRYGASGSAGEFIMKAQLSQYESVRAMFESYSAMKSDPDRPATGIIMWMYNMAIPGMGWQLHDYYLKPTSATFAAQKACSRTLHVSYNYSTRSVWINNESYNSYANYKVSAKVCNLDLTEKYANEQTIDSIAANTSLPAFTIGDVGGLSSVYFIKLQLKDAFDNELEDNIYWYGTTEDIMDYDVRGNDGCATTQYANLADLSTLPTNNDVMISGSRTTSNGEDTVSITVGNPTAAILAFFMRVEVTGGPDGQEVTPVTYTDNYCTLWPGESRTITARYDNVDLCGNAPYLRIRGHNVPKKTGSIVSP